MTDRRLRPASAVALIGVIAWLSAGRAAPDDRPFVAVDYARRTIYHSPQTPGYTCWVGAWPLPDGGMMATFKQATGPLEGRPRSVELLKRMELGSLPADRDFTGLRLANIYLHSPDGAEWTPVAEEEFPGPLDRPTWGGSHIALKDGALLRAVDGSQLPRVPDLPRRIYFQRSRDRGKTWGDPLIPPLPTRPVEGYLGDYGDCISRVRRLRDGRLLAIGVSVLGGKGDQRIWTPFLMTSTDEGRTWRPALRSIREEYCVPGAWNEWDAAELSNGDLLCVVRRYAPGGGGRQVRWQGHMRRDGNRWTLAEYGPSPLPHSGHPELRTTREGIVLHIATTGVDWTADAGKSWRPLAFPGMERRYASRYYPDSFQLDDGRIFVFSHNGWDNAYGEFDQSIVMDAFRLTRE